MRTFTVEHIHIPEKPPYTPTKTKKTYFIDENKSDYEIRFKNGEVLTQKTPFHIEEGDWNNDGAIYEVFGAVFTGGNRKEFFELHELADLIDDGRAIIKGINFTEVK